MLHSVKEAEPKQKLRTKGNLSRWHGDPPPPRTIRGTFDASDLPSWLTERSPRAPAECLSTAVSHPSPSQRGKGLLGSICMHSTCVSTSGLCSLAGNLGTLLLQASARKPSASPGGSWRPGRSGRLLGFQGARSQGSPLCSGQPSHALGAGPLSGPGLGPRPHFNDGLEPSTLLTGQALGLLGAFSYKKPLQALFPGYFHLGLGILS